MESSLSCLTNNLANGLHNNKCKEYKSCFEYIKDTYLRVLSCNKNHKNYSNKYLVKMLDFWTCINFAMGTLINFIQC